MSNSTKNMTHGSPTKLLLGFVFPMLLGNFFQQLYNIVDVAIVGKWLGLNALAAVGATSAINFMVLGFCIGACSGFAIPVAQYFGSGDYSSLRKYVANSVWASLAFAVAMTLSSCLLCAKMLEWMHTPLDIKEDTYSYIFVIFLGIPMTYLYNLLASILRALGDSKTPVYFLALSSVLNIILDVLSIRILGMGVAGAAWATVIAQGLSGLLCLAYMIKKFEILHIKKEEWSFHGNYVKHLCAMGIPIGLQYSVTAIGGIILQRAVNGIGSTAVAAITTGEKISSFVASPFSALGTTMLTYVGQNVGAKKLERIPQGIKSAVVISTAYSVAACAILLLFGKHIALLFIDAKEAKLIDQIYLFLIINSLCYLLLAVIYIFRFCIQGMGFTTLSILSGVCEMLARIAVSFGLVPWFGYVAVCFSNPLAWLLADLFLIPTYAGCLKKLCCSLKEYI